MTMRRAATAVGLALCLSATAHAARLALVVGNDTYRHVAPLKNAVRDAELMQQTLQAAGFEVTLLRNQGRQGLYDAVDQFQRRLNNGDEVVFFFAGHGVQVASDQVLLPVDIQADDEKKVLREGVPLLYVQDALKGARLAMLVVDACRDNPFPKPAGTRSIGEARGLKPPEVAKGQVVILSAGRDQKALDTVPGEPSARNGLFTWEFAQVLRTPGLDVLTALRRVRDRVEDRAASVGHAQRPSLVDDLRGQFYLASAPPPPPSLPTPSPAPAPGPAPVPMPEPRPAAPPAPEPVTASLPAGQIVKDCSECPELVVVPAGEFLMGSPASEPGRLGSEGPQRRVKVASFLVGRYEVTFEQWDVCMAARGCSRKPGDEGWGRGKRPVINVSWEDAQQYVKWLSGKTGKAYRLLSEAEWEYAARAGSGAAYAWGADIGRNRANCDGCGSKWDNKQTAPVGSFEPNALGVSDMHGNVWEWVQDVLHVSYSGAPSDGSAWMSSGEQSRRVLRGGSWVDVPRNLRSADRYWNSPGSRFHYTGFRIARNN